MTRQQKARFERDDHTETGAVWSELKLELESESRLESQHGGESGQAREARCALQMTR